MYLGRHIPDMIKLILKKSRFFNKFKQIYDKLDNTIMIVNKNNYSIEYMNDFFFTMFSEMIKENPVDENDPCSYNNLIDMKMFEIYKSEDSKPMSLRDILDDDRAEGEKLDYVFA